MINFLLPIYGAFLISTYKKVFDTLNRDFYFASFASV